MADQVLRPAEKSAGRECRVYERLACDLSTACRPASAFANKEATWPAVIRDISVGGIGLTLRRRFEPGTALAIELPASNDGDVYPVFAKVVYARILDDASWTLGCKFVSELSESELERVMRSLGHPVASRSARSAQSQAGHVSAWGAETVADGAAEPEILHDVRFRLLMRRGVLIECVFRRFKVDGSWPLPAGKVTSLRAGGNDSRYSKLRVQVLQCARHEGQWTLSCRLVDPPSAANLWRALAALDRDAK